MAPASLGICEEGVEVTEMHQISGKGEENEEDSLHEVIFLCRALGNAHESHDPGELLFGGEVGERGLGVACFMPPSRIDSGGEGGRGT